MELCVRVRTKDRAELELREKSVVSRVEVHELLSRSLLQKVMEFIENKKIDRIIVEGGKTTFSSFKVAVMSAKVIGWYRDIPVTYQE